MNRMITEELVFEDHHVGFHIIVNSSCEVRICVSLLPAGPCTSQKSNSSVTLLDTSKVI